MVEAWTEEAKARNVLLLQSGWGKEQEGVFADLLRAYLGIEPGDSDRSKRDRIRYWMEKGGGE